ncbi:hypothetical protein CLOM_g22906 [Closterium sp. NIES-68]|nr:hypothetical protein CLOM_g22906 [Closterium sp. NIES-68]
MADRDGDGGGEFECSPSSNGSNDRSPLFENRPKRLSNCKLATISVIAAGIQFGWALQLSLLTPYVQTLGIPHVWASFVWLCGPISGLLVQPLVGVWSDSCRSPWGRRRPFIFTGALLVMAAVLVIGFSADLGYLLGDEPHPQGG